jgi:V8-like Glu-specific endopeptidase
VNDPKPENVGTAVAADGVTHDTPVRFEVPDAFSSSFDEDLDANSPDGRVRDSTMVETNLGAILEPGVPFDRPRIMSRGLLGPGIDTGPERPELAFGEEVRWKTVPDTTACPWRSICHLLIRFDLNTATGTAWFVAPDILLTAGHNVFHHSAGWARDIIVTPGKNGATTAPFGQTFAEAGDVHPQWRSSDARDYTSDIAYLKVPDPRFGRRLGCFGLRVMSDRELRRGMLFQVAGYPEHGGDQQWLDGGRLLRFDRHYILHRFDTEKGSSGGPVFAAFANGQRLVVASHSHGLGSGTANAAVRITDAIFDQIHGWIG